MALIHVSPLTPTQLSTIAREYLARVHPTGELPIPIEAFIDLSEKIDIVPVEGLRETEHEAYTARDRKTIYVDKGIFCHQNPNRYRFTLAHELSHILIHQGVFDAAEYNDIAGFKRFLSEIGDTQMRQIERQAYQMAGFLLVPTSDLSEQYANFAEELEKHDIDITNLTPDQLRYIAKKLGEQFQVSAAVIHRCAVRDWLWAWDDIPNI